LKARSTFETKATSFPHMRPGEWKCVALRVRRTAPGVSTCSADARSARPPSAAPRTAKSTAAAGRQRSLRMSSTSIARSAPRARFFCRFGPWDRGRSRYPTRARDIENHGGKARANGQFQGLPAAAPARHRSRIHAGSQASQKRGRGLRLWSDARLLGRICRSTSARAGGRPSRGPRRSEAGAGGYCAQLWGANTLQAVWCAI
jgi:hypothetical protein